MRVMNLISAGYKDVAIARRLDVSVVTVRRRASSFRKRVGASNRAEAVALGMVRGWIRPASAGLDGSEGGRSFQPE